MENEIQKFDSTIEHELERFNITETAIKNMEEKYLPLKLNGLQDKEGYKVIKAARMAVKGYRIDVDKRRKEMTADALKFQRAINERAKAITARLSPIEDSLSSEEDRYDQEQERIKKAKEEEEAAKLQDRVNKLMQFGYIFNGICYKSDYMERSFTTVELRMMLDPVFDDLLFTVEVAYNKHIIVLALKRKEKEEKQEREDSERKAEIEKLEKIRREQQEERIRLEELAFQQKEKEDYLLQENIPLIPITLTAEDQKEPKPLPEIEDSLQSKEVIGRDKIKGYSCRVKLTLNGKTLGFLTFDRHDARNEFIGVYMALFNTSTLEWRYETEIID